MNAWLEAPWQAIAVLLALLGLCVGNVINWAATTWCHFPQPISPWARQHPRDNRDSLLDRLPLFGWWRLRRKTPQLGVLFWLRSIVVELGTAALFAWLYWWEVVTAALVPDLPWNILPSDLALPLHATLVPHLLLVALMLVATLVDIDEQTIPDSTTITGTLLALALAVALPQAALPTAVSIEGELTTLNAATPHDWPQLWNARPQPVSLVLALSMLAVWCVGLLPRPWRTRHGWRRALAILAARVMRSAETPWLLGMGAVCGLGVTAVWYVGGPRWTSLFSALLGMFVGGLLVWLTRVIGQWALQTEAMGFGDVTLLAMIGAFVGWQPSLFVFLFAPFAALVLGIAQWATHRKQALPYGPFLCLATLGVVTGWAPLWRGAAHYFVIPWLVPGVLVVCFVLLVVMLAVLQVLKRLAA